MEEIIASIVMQMRPPVELCNSEAVLKWRLERAVSYTVGWCIAKNYLKPTKNW